MTRKIKIKEQRGFGFVTFGTIDEANEALQADHVLHEQEIEVKRAMPNRFAQSSRQDSHLSQPALVDQSQGSWFIQVLLFRVLQVIVEQKLTRFPYI